MKLLYSWLREISGTALGPEELAEALTMRGTSIASIERTGPAWDRMVAARVLETRPLGDNLVMARVAAGGDTLDVACGAPNCRAGLDVALALPGARLPGGVEIATRTIQGGTSSGMLLSLAELGLSSDKGASGIVELPAGARPGDALARVLDLDDWVLDAEITFNRGDCLSHLGVAREIAAMGEGAVRLTADARAREGGAIQGRVSVRIEAPEGCPRYVARVVDEITVGPSPLAIARRLALLGSRLVNNVVDATNYLLLECGQPLHAFDLDRVPGGAIVVRYAAGETLVTLDGDARTLGRETLAICDANRPIALAGIMGGKHSEVGDTTRAVLLESAEFDPVATRRGAKAVGLSTDASYRFERGVDPAGVDRASRRAAALIASLSGGRVVSGEVVAGPPPVAPREVELRTARVNAMLASELRHEEIARHLRALGMEPAGGETMRVRVPSWRRDVTGEPDLVEEVARLHGYDRLPSQSSVRRTVPRESSPRHQLVERTRDLLPGLGFSEAVTVSLLDAGRVTAWHAAIGREGAPAAQLTNPISEALSTLRPHLVPGLLDVVATNLNRRRRPPRFFEVGAVFTSHRAADGAAAPADGGRDASRLPEERWHLAVALSGPAREPAWDDPARPADFFDLRGLVEAYHAALGIAPPDFRPLPWPLFAGGLGAEIRLEGESIGFMGELGARFREERGLRQATLVLEVDLDRVAAACTAVARRHRELPRHPALERDIAVVVDRDVAHAEIERLVREEGGELVEATRLFDLYTGEQIAAGKKSLAFTVTLRAPERTLTEEEAQAVRRRIAERVARELGATLRE